jgi:hypothetical protein
MAGKNPKPIFTLADHQFLSLIFGQIGKARVDPSTIAQDTEITSIQVSFYQRNSSFL